MKIKLAILVALLTLPGVVCAQTSRSGRVTQGSLATRPNCPIPANTGDFYAAIDQTPVTVAVCSSSGWTAIGGGGTTVTLQTNTVNNSSQTTLNLINSATNSVGLTATFSNTSGGNVKVEIAGLLLDAGLSSAYSGVGSCAANQWVNTLTRNAAPGCAQPAFSNLSGTATTGQLPASIVYNNQVNTGTAAMTLDLSASTVPNAFKVPVGAGLTVSANGAVAFDSTNNNFHLGVAGADAFVPSMTAAPTSGNCANYSVVSGRVKLTDAGAPCGTSGFSNPMTTLGDLMYENAVPAAARLAGPTSPNGIPQTLTETPSGGLAQVPAWGLAGMVNRDITGAATTDTIANTDCTNIVTNKSSAAVAATLPTATTLLIPSCVLSIANNGNSTYTITPTTWTINGQSSLAMQVGQTCRVSVDGATNWKADCYEPPLTAIGGIVLGRTPTGLNISSSGGGTGVFYLLDYGVVPDGKLCYGTNVGTTNGNQTVTCSTATFTSADVGKSIEVTTGCCGVQRQILGGLVTPESTITSINSATSVQVSNNSTFTCTANAACLLAWGTLNDTAISAAETAANALSQNCPAYIVPSGLILFHGKHWNSVPTQCQFGNQLGVATSYSESIIGQGQASSVLIPLSGFDTVAGSGSCGTAGCIFNNNAQYIVEHLTFYGLGCGNCGTANEQLIAGGEGSQFSDVAFAGYGGTTAGGFKFNATRCKFCSFDGWGTSVNVISNGNGTNICLWCFFGDYNSVMTIGPAGAADFTDIGGDWYGPEGNGGINIVVTAGNLHMVGTRFGNGFTNANAFGIVANGGNVYLSNVNWPMTGCGTQCTALKVQNASSVAHVQGSVLTGSGTGNPVLVTAGKFFDDGGNTISGGAGQSFSSGTTIGGIPVIEGTCTGTATASSTLGLYLLGNNTTTACTSTTVNQGYVAKATPTTTLANLFCTAGTGGVNASSGVVTVLKNGGATTLTGTFGTGTAVNDNTHTASFAVGDIISVQFTTQAAETLANVKCSVSTL